MAFPKKAKRTLIEGISSGDYDLSDPDMTAATITTVNATHLNDADTDALKLHGYVSTRNTADNSMYIATTAASGYERGVKIAYAPSANAGGYFDSLYVNTKTTGTATGEYRAIEAKTTVASNLAASAIATGVYAKVNVSGASNEVATAIGVDILLEEEDSGTITSGIGIRVQGGSGAIHTGIDVSGSYGLIAIKSPSVSGGSISAANLNTAFGITEGALSGDTGFVGLYKDTGDSNAIKAVFKYDGVYHYVKLSDAS